MYEIARVQAYPSSQNPNWTFNCLGMALKNVDLIQFGELGITSDADKRDVDKVADAIVSYAKSNHCINIADAVKIEGEHPTGEELISENQYYVAVRVMEHPLKVLDFHIIAQTNTGTWINKHGKHEIEKLGYIDPNVEEQDCWYSSSDGYFYDSKTVYILITLD